MISKIKDGIHVVAIDDAPHERGDLTTELFFTYCKGTFLEKVTLSQITVDGLDATSVIMEELKNEKDSYTLILLHSSTVGGLNIVDIHHLSKSLQKPILAVTENVPTDRSIYHALEQLPNSKKRKNSLNTAGLFESFMTSHGSTPIYYHSQNIDQNLAREFFKKFCIRSRLPEQLLLAHKIASAKKK